jgi:dienelactone hydrolase
MRQETVVYYADGLEMRGQLVLEPASGPRAGVLVFPEAFGLDDHAIMRAKQLAELGYVALACDLHGDGRIVEDLNEAMWALQPLFDDPSRTRARTTGALGALAARPEVNEARIGAMGFCFPASIELARSGADIKAAVGFHTSLASKLPVTEHGAIRAHVLVCIGADDPFITADQRENFESEMRSVGANWQMDVFGGTVHSFMSPNAARRNMPEAIRYNPDAEAGAWTSALDLFERTLM